MKYVIKRRDEVMHCFIEYVYPNEGYFRATDKLEKAIQFSTLGEAIDAIVRRDVLNPILQGTKFTIVGIKEISTPRYEEVIL